MFFLAASLAVVAHVQCFTSSRSVTGLVSTGPGTFAAATSGGLLLRAADGKWTKETVADGLPSNELESAASSGGALAVEVGDQWWSQAGAKWTKASDAPTVPVARAHTVWGAGLFVGDKPFSPQLPDAAKTATCCATDGTHWVVGTSDNGLWELHGDAWAPVDLNEPSGNSIQAVTLFGGAVYVSTLQSGLDVYRSGRWSRVQGLSSGSPREMVVFQGALWVRNAEGTVDRLQDGKWSADCLKGILPRKEARYLATDGERLYVAEWAGWSVFDGKTWTHDLQRPEFAGVATTCLLPDGGTLWVGTQGKSLAHVQGGKVTWVDERAGLNDDWVTCLAKDGEGVLVGTFVGGLYRVTGDKAVFVEGSDAQDVTCLAPGLVGTRQWVKVLDGPGLHSFDPQLSEVQALARDGNDVWVGTRTGLFRLTIS